MKQDSTELYTNTLWKILTIVCGAGVVFQAHSIFEFQSEAQKLGIPKNEFSDLYIMVLAFSVLTGLRWIFGLSVRPAIRTRLLQLDPENLNMKLVKNSRAFFGILWYIFITV